MSDAADLLKKYSTDDNFRTLVYLDPPYFEKGRQLYYNYYEEDDHAVIADVLREVDSRFSWVVSYDSVPQIAALYRGFRSIEYSINYSARSAGTRSEEHTSGLQSLMRISYAVFCLKKKKKILTIHNITYN